MLESMLQHLANVGMTVAMFQQHVFQLIIQ